MSLTFASRSFSTGFFGGGSLSDEVPSRYPVALDGHPFLLDMASEAFRHVTIPILKQQTQVSDAIGEQSINPAGLWRRSIETWHKGAGQTNYDLADSDRARFRSSKGVDVWSMWQLSLLPATDQKRSSANTNLRTVPVGSRLYLIDGADIVHTDDVTGDSPTWTGITGESATAANGAASDGFHLWTIHGTDGLYQTDNSASATTKGVTGNLRGMLAYVKGRIIASDNNSVYNITAIDTGTPEALPTALLVHPNTDFEWVGAAPGPSHIYLAGYSGDKSLIYKTAIEADGTSLGTPTVAGELPDGEIVRSVYGYLGFLCIGTDRGVRLATMGDDGNLTIGALIVLDVAVACFEGQDRFVWFGWTNYDATSTGLGRLDLSMFNETAPAYASDLMATAQGAVCDVATFEGRRIFAVSGVGVWAEEATLVSAGSLDSGLISFGIPERKIALAFDTRFSALAGSVSVWLDPDGTGFSVAASATTAGSMSQSVAVGEIGAERFEVRVALEPDVGAADGPHVHRLVLSSNPTANTGFRILAPVLLNFVDETVGGDVGRNPAAEMRFIERLRTSRDIVIWQEGSRTFPVSLEDFTWFPLDIGTVDGEVMWAGTCVLDMKVN